MEKRVTKKEMKNYILKQQYARAKMMQGFFNLPWKQMIRNALIAIAILYGLYFLFMLFLISNS